MEQFRPVLEENFFVVLVVRLEHQLFLIEAIKEILVFIVERRCSFSRQNLSQIFFSSGSIVHAVKPYSEEVQLIFGQFMFGVDQKNTSRTDLRVHFVVMILLWCCHQNDKSIFSMQVLI